MHRTKISLFLMCKVENDLPLIDWLVAVKRDLREKISGELSVPAISIFSFLLHQLTCHL